MESCAPMASALSVRVASNNGPVATGRRMPSCPTAR
jgi:hypothetical protein